MNREILFRGKRKDNKEWVYGYLVKSEDYIFDYSERIDIPYVIPIDNFNLKDYREYRVIPETVSQYTGLEDKNGNKIFEVDIVQWSNIKMEIFWGEHIGIGYGFCWRPYGEEQSYHESMTGFIDEYEVIGNIFDEKE